MKLYKLLEVVNDDVRLKGYDKEGNLITEGTRNDNNVKSYEEWIIDNMWTEQDGNSSYLSFHIIID